MGIFLDGLIVSPLEALVVKDQELSLGEDKEQPAPLVATCLPSPQSTELVFLTILAH